MEAYTFFKADKTINDVPLESLIFETRQRNWDGESIKNIGREWV